MVRTLDNPYRGDSRARDLFVGRAALISELLSAFTTGRRAIRAVMGGRGIGKSSLADQIISQLASRVKTILVSGDVGTVWRALVLGLGSKLDLDDPVGSLAMVVSEQAEDRVLIVIDEIERILADPQGRAFLDNLREAYEQSNHRLCILVLGGTEVRDLLVDEASPFLRVAGGVHHLAGLSREETAQLLKQPLALEIADDVIDSLWAGTAGHPLLLQMFMERAVELANSADREVVDCIPEAMRAMFDQPLSQTVFPIWWSNLRSRGQDCYRRLLQSHDAIPKDRWVEAFGDDPRPWLDILESTGVASSDGKSILPRGDLFRQWVGEAHPALVRDLGPAADAMDRWLDSIGAHEFERLIIRSLSTWARTTIEFPALALRQAKSGATELQPEASFQISALLALLQHSERIFAEPEPLSAAPRSRSDIKVRDKRETSRRACVEFKIYGRDSDRVVRQVIDYGIPEDVFAAVVMIDRRDRALEPEYRANCFADAVPSARVDAPTAGQHPAFFTEHPRVAGPHLRVWHFLIQLPAR